MDLIQNNRIDTIYNNLQILLESVISPHKTDTPNLLSIKTHDLDNVRKNR